MTRRVLLVAPAFHRYWASLATALREDGDEVVVHVYDEHPGLAEKVRAKAFHELPLVLGWTEQVAAARAATRAACRALEAADPDAVLAVRGDLLRDDFWDEVHRRRLPSVLWLYDELDRVPLPDDLLRGLDLVATYSASDCARLAAEGVEATVVENAFDQTLTWTPVPSDGPVFVGARYPGRERTLVALHRAGVPVHVVGRDWSHHPVDRLRTWSIRRPPLPARREVTLEESLGLLAGAPAAINLHERQDGFTMRTFEACGVGALQLVDRADVARLYEPDEEIVVFDGVEELAELCRRATTDGAWRRRIGAAARARTLAEHTFTHRARVLSAAWR